jgi:LuxR family maltose regulon positive regulatory protein
MKNKEQEVNNNNSNRNSNSIMQERIYLSERLNTSLDVIMGTTATLVEAPTGYGKTVAIRELCKRTNLPVKWINIYDEDLLQAWGTVCREMFNNTSIVQRLLKWPFPYEGIQRDYFADEMEKIIAEGPILIVIDDYHLIQGRQTGEFMRYLIKEFYGRIHIVIISQKAVFQNEEFLVGTGKLNRIGVEDLRLSRKDFEAYLEMYQLDIRNGDLELVYEKSEGWVSMIYVSVLNYIRMGKSDLSADMEHLVDRVAYMACSPKTQYFLSYMALVQDFTKEQADFLNNGEDCEEMLQELLQKNSFFGKDPNTGKYHFHTIFKDCIYHHFERLSLSERCIRYERMAEYQIQQKNYYEALRWYERAGNYESVLRTLELFETICSNQEDCEVMIRCYDNCPKGLFEDYPLSLILFMWRFFNYGEKERLAECQQLFEQLMVQIQFAQEDKDYLWKAYYVFLSQSAFNDLDKMRYYTEKAMTIQTEELPEIDWDVPRTFGIPSVAHMFYTGGTGESLVQKLGDYLDAYELYGIHSYQGVKSLIEAEYFYYAGDFAQAEILCHKAYRQCSANGLISYMVNIQYLNAHLAYMRGDFKEAKKILNEIRSEMLHNRTENSRLLYTVDMCEAFFNHYIGYPTHLAEWLRDTELPKEIMPQAYPYAYMVKMEVALYDERYAEILSSVDEEILKIVSEYPNKMTLGGIYLIVASAAASMSRTEEAKAYICKAVELIGYGPVMLYAKYGNWLVTPLQELAEEDEAYKPIIVACRKFSALGKSARSQESTGIFPVLTKRENDIALLAVDGFTNREIAAKLFISENTVKSSLKNIFAKLEINSRRELLKVAQLGATSI